MCKASVDTLPVFQQQFVMNRHTESSHPNSIDNHSNGADTGVKRRGIRWRCHHQSFLRRHKKKGRFGTHGNFFLKRCDSLYNYGRSGKWKKASQNIDSFSEEGGTCQRNEKEKGSKILPLSSFRVLLTRGVNSDLTLISNERKEFEAHWLALSSRIKYFAGMWKSQMKEVTEGSVNLDANNNVMEFVLAWVYGEETNCLSSKEMSEVVELALFWSCPDLGRFALFEEMEKASARREIIDALTVYGLAVALGPQQNVIAAGKKLLCLKRVKTRMQELDMDSFDEKLPGVALWAVWVLIVAVKTETPHREFETETAAAWHFKMTNRSPLEMCDLRVKGLGGSTHNSYKVLWLDSLFGGELKTNPTVDTIEVPLDDDMLEILIGFMNGHRPEFEISVEQFAILYKFCVKNGTTELLTTLESCVWSMTQNMVASERTWERACLFLSDLLAISADFPLENLTTVCASLVSYLAKTRDWDFKTLDDDYLAAIPVLGLPTFHTLKILLRDDDECGRPSDRRQFSCFRCLTHLTNSRNENLRQNGVLFNVSDTEGV